MEHKLIQGGEQFLPFARSRIKALKATGLKYASQKFEIDGVSVKVRIAGEHEYIELSGGTTSGLYLVFAEIPTAISGQAAVLQYGAATGGNVCATLNEKLMSYTAYGTEVPNPKKFKSVALGAHVPDVPRQATLFTLLSFYDGLPVKYKRFSDSPLASEVGGQAPIPSSAPGADLNNPDNWDSSNSYVILEDRSSVMIDILHGDRSVVSGSYQEVGTEKLETRMAANQEITYTGFVISGEESQTASNFISAYWAGWNMVAVMAATGSETSSFVAPGDWVTSGGIPPAEFYPVSLGDPKKVKNKEVVDVLSAPPRTNISAYRDYYSSNVSAAPPSKPDATPLDRHLLDFYYLKNRVDAGDVRAVCKSIVYCWTSLQGYKIHTPIKAINYKTGSTWEIDAPQLFDPEFEVVAGQVVIPPDYTPRYIVFYDDYIVRVTNDPVTANFWMYVYESTVSAYSIDLATGLPSNIKLISCTTNKPGELGAGHEKTKQIVIKDQPEKSYLIGAMRDEVACM